MYHTYVADPNPISSSSFLVLRMVNHLVLSIVSGVGGTHVTFHLNINIYIYKYNTRLPGHTTSLAADCTLSSRTCHVSMRCACAAGATFRNVPQPITAPENRGRHRKIRNRFRRFSWQWQIRRGYGSSTLTILLCLWD